MPEYVDEPEDAEIEPPPIPESILDSWMLTHFPGRFLDEITNSMDIYRFLRSLQARGIEAIEDTRERFRENKIKSDEITEDQWKEIRRHDRMMAYLIRGK